MPQHSPPVNDPADITDILRDICGDPPIVSDAQVFALSRFTDLLEWFAGVPYDSADPHDTPESRLEVMLDCSTSLDAIDLWLVRGMIGPEHFQRYAGPIFCMAREAFSAESILRHLRHPLRVDDDGQAFTPEHRPLPPPTQLRRREVMKIWPLAAAPCFRPELLSRLQNLWDIWTGDHA